MGIYTCIDTLAHTNPAHRGIVVTDALAEHGRPIVYVYMRELCSAQFNGRGNEHMVQLLRVLIEYIAITFDFRDAGHLIDVSQE